jgi:hypothetical protein
VLQPQQRPLQTAARSLLHSTYFLIHILFSHFSHDRVGLQDCSHEQNSVSQSLKSDISRVHEHLNLAASQINYLYEYLFRLHDAVHRAGWLAKTE